MFIWAIISTPSRSAGRFCRNNSSGKKREKESAAFLLLSPLWRKQQVLARVACRHQYLTGTSCCAAVTVKVAMSPSLCIGCHVLWSAQFSVQLCLPVILSFAACLDLKYCSNVLYLYTHFLTFPPSTIVFLYLALLKLAPRVNLCHVLSPWLVGAHGIFHQSRPNVLLCTSSSTIPAASLHSTFAQQSN